jgi:hypothetical protein
MTNTGGHAATRVRPQHRALRTATGTLLAVGALAASVLAAGPAGAASTTNGPISRAEVNSRAQVWLGNTNITYSQSGTYADQNGVAYRRDCSGFVSMALHLSSPGLDTVSFPTVLSSINPSQAIPGDVIGVLGAGTSGDNGHIQLFEGWNNSQHTSVHVWEQGGSPDYPHAADYSWPESQINGKSYAMYRYNNITGNTESLGYLDASDGTFHLRNELSPGSSEYAFGGAPAGSGVIPLTGDWDGTGHAGTGYYNKADGTFHLRDELSPGSSEHAFGFGPTGANIVPVVGDWDGDGHTSIGYFNTTDGTFHLRNSLSPGGSDYAFGFAPAGSGIVPVTGDWDGDGHTSIGYFNTGDGTFHLRNSLSPGGSDYAFGFAPAGSGIVPVTGDWDGDGHTSIGYFNTGDGTIHLRNSLSPGGSDYAYPAAPAGSGITPVTGDWDGM